MSVDVRELSEKATQAAAGAWDQAHGLVSELVERGKEFDVPQRVERAAEAIREPALHAVEAIRDPALHAVEAIREPAQHAVEAIREPAQHAVEALREPAERAAVEVRRHRPWTLIACIGAGVVALVVGRVWWQRRAQRQQLAHLGTAEGRTDPFGPDARYQERAVSAVS